MTKISLIAAVSDNGLIGAGNGLPWRIKSELQYFMRVTKHKPHIMGRKTFETLPGPLKDRANIVITRDPAYRRDGVTVVPSLEEAFRVAEEIARETGADEIMVGGGAEIYKLALPHADRLYLTEIHMQAEGDTAFPAFDAAEWTETKREYHAAQAGETADYTITVRERK